VRLCGIMSNGLKFIGYDNIPNLGHVEWRVVYCGVTFPYLIFSHPAEGDDSSGGDRN
jgi:hypothetical protein